jgi:hypothetical protein
MKMVSSDQIVGLGLIAAVAFFAFNIWYSYKTGVASVWVMQIPKKDAPRVFVASIVLQVFLAVMCAIAWILWRVGTIR